jgi:hypothetical protein
MTSAIYVNEVMACLPQTMIDKLEYACKAYIQELLIRKKDEDKKGGNKELYSWLNVVNAAVFHDMLDEINDPVLESVVSDYFIPEDEPMLRRFTNNHYFYDKITQKSQHSQVFLLAKLGMFIYINIHEKTFKKDISRGIIINLHTNDLK